MSYILENLAIEFGNSEPHEPECHEEGEEEYEQMIRESGEPYPAIDPRGGGYRERVNWPEAGFECVVHALNPDVTVLKEDDPAPEMR